MLPNYILLFPLTTALPPPQYIFSYWGSERVIVYPEETIKI